MVINPRPTVDTVNRVGEVDCFADPVGRPACGTRTPRLPCCKKYRCWPLGRSRKSLDLSLLGFYTFCCIVLNRRG
jgi:hypothetical protein